MAKGKQTPPTISAAQQEQITKVASKTASAYKTTLAIIEAINKGLIKTDSQLTSVLTKLSNADFKSLQKLSSYLDDGTDSFKDWQKQLDRIDRMTKLALTREIEKRDFSKEALKNLEDQRDVQEEMLEDLEDIVDLNKELKNTSKDIFDLNGALRNVMTSLSAQQISQLDTLTSINTTYDSIKSNIIDQVKQLGDFKIPNAFENMFPADQMDSITKVYNSMLENLGGDTFEIQGEVGLDFDSAQAKLNQFGIDTVTDLNKKFDTITEAIALKFGVSTDLIKKYIQSIGDPGFDLNIDDTNQINLLLKYLPDVGDVSKQSFNILTVAAMQSGDKISVLVAEVDKFNATLKNVKEAREIFLGVESAIGDIGLTIQRQVDSVMPNWMQSFFGVREAISGIQDAAKKSIGSAIQIVANGGTTLEAMQVFSSGLLSNFSAMLGPLAKIGLLLGGALIAITGLWKLMTSLENTAKEYSTQLGTSRQRGAELYKQTLDIVSASNNRLATEKDVQEILKNHQEKYGTILDLSKQSNQDMIKFAASLGKTYGISSAEAATLIGQFKNMGASMEESKGLSLWLAQASELAGISFSEVTKDLAESTREVALYYQGMPKQAAKAVIQIKKMGMSMKQVGKVMDKSLDIGGFYQDMTELSIMTGGAANLQKFFDLRFSGAKPDQLAGEIADQFDRMVESGQDNEFNLRKFAEATGMEVEELVKSRKIRKELAGLSEEQQKKLNQHLDSLSEADLADSNAAMAAAERLDTQDKMNVAMDKMKAVLMKALLPLAESLSEAFSAALPFLNVIGDVLKLIGGILSHTIIPAFQGVMIPVSFIGNILKTVYDFTAKLFGAAVDTGGAFSDIGEQIKTVIKYIAAGITTLFLISGNFTKAFTWPFQLVKSLIPGMKGGLSDVFNGAGDGVKKLGQKIVSMFNGAGDGTKTLGSKIASVFKGGEDGSKSLGEKIKSIFKGGEAGTQSLTDRMKAFFKGGEDGSKSLTDRIKGIFTSNKKLPDVKDATSTITESVSKAKPIASAAEKIPAPDTKSVTESAKKTGNVFSKLGETLKSIGAGIKTALQSIVDFITTSLKKIVTSISSSLQTLAKAIGNSLNAIGKGIGTSLSSIGKGIGNVVSTISKSIGTSLSSIGKGIGDTITSISKSIGTGITSIVKGVSDSLSALSKAVGTALTSIGSGVGKFIESVLSGIGNGLNAFRLNALMGATALAVVAGALWIMGDAVKKFTEVGWEDLGKAMVALGGLAGIALLLSAASVNMLIGSVAILALGAALIPLAYSLTMLQGVGFESIIALGGALVILGTAASIMGPLLPLMLLGSIAIAALGASLIPLAYALNQAGPAIAEAAPIIESFGTVIDSVFKGLASLIETAANSFGTLIASFASLDPTSLFGAAAGIAAIAGALAVLGGGSALGGVGSAIGEFFGGDPVAKLERFAALASPLQIVADSIERIAQSLNSLSESLAGVDLGRLEQMGDSVKKGKISFFATSALGQSTSETGAATNQKYLETATTPVKQGMTAQKSIATEGLVATNPTTNVEVAAPVVKTTTSNGSFKDIQDALLAIAKRPIIVKIGDMELKTLNKQFRGMNNNV